MKIGVMLRHYKQHEGGVHVYTRNLLKQLLTIDNKNEYVLIYADKDLIGTYGDRPNVRELAIGVPTKFLWDQIGIPLTAKQEKLDLIFNPKYSLPLWCRQKTVFVCHGLDWYVMPSGSRWIDRLSHRYLIPMYACKADAIIAVSNTVREHVITYLRVEEKRVHTVYHGVDEAFRNPVTQERLDEIRHSYQLPERFFLYCGQIYPPKNFGRLLEAYARVGPEFGIRLVVAGEPRWLCRGELALIDKLGLSRWVVRTGWIDRDTLPAFYCLAKALVLPSLYESFGLPLLEAMASGCPVVTADRYGTKELAGEAGILVDPEDIGSIADGMIRVVTDDWLRQRLIKAGRQRASNFTWTKCAHETLRTLEGVLSST
jgi:O-antigen biosynthesis alpha-1,2-mannosyltransferase